MVVTLKYDYPIESTEYGINSPVAGIVSLAKGDFDETAPFHPPPSFNRCEASTADQLEGIRSCP